MQSLDILFITVSQGLAQSLTQRRCLVNVLTNVWVDGIVIYQGVSEWLTLLGSAISEWYKMEVYQFRYETEYIIRIWQFPSLPTPSGGIRVFWGQITMSLNARSDI